MDEVLAQFTMAFLAFHNGRYGTAFSMDQVKEYEIFKLWGGTQEEFLERMRHFHGSEEYARMPPVPDAIGAIEQLEREHDLFLITARPESWRVSSVEWLDENFPDIFRHEHMHFSPMREGWSKGAVCAELSVDVMIEDAMHNALDCVSHGVPAILIDYPWNQGDLPEGITRVTGWPEVLDTIRTSTFLK